MVSNYTGYYTFGDNGVVIPNTSDILEEVQAEFQTALGEDISLEESTPQGRLIDTETNARQATIGFNANIANTLINIAMSSGTALDAWGANFNVYRNGATASTVPVTVTGVAGTVIPANSEASTSNGVIWLSQSEIIIGTNGSATGTFICSQTGPVSLGIGELTNIVATTTTGLNGWETITNTSNATLGSTVESDASFKLRIFAAMFSGTALFGNYASAAYKVSGVTNVYVKENPYSTSLILDDITIPAHSIYVCVLGGNSYDVAFALYSVKSAGCGWCGNTTVTITDNTYNTTATVTYNVPTAVGLTSIINLTSTLNSNANLETDVQNILVNYFSNQYSDINYPAPLIKGTISPFTIASLLNSQLSGVTINSVQIGELTPTNRATVTIIKASITSGIIWASVDTTTFAGQLSTDGQYNFIYNGSNWTYNSDTVTLSTYGISALGSPVNGDIISILFSTGNLSQSPIGLFASEYPTIAAENITVNINE